MNELVLYPSKSKMVRMAAYSLMLVCVIFGLCLALWQYLPGTFSSLYNAIIFYVLFYTLFCVGLPALGFNFLFVCYKLIVPKPAVIVNHEGIFDNASAVSAGLVKWDEIADIFAYYYSSQRFLGVVPLNVEAFLQRLPVFKRWLIKVFMMITGAPPIGIPQSMLPIEVDELMLRIHEYRQNRLG
jgi:hypothetical protein